VNFCKDVAVWTFVEHEDYEFAELEPDDEPFMDASSRALTDSPGQQTQSASTSKAASKALAKRKAQKQAEDLDPDHRYFASYQYNARFAEYLEWARVLPEVDEEREYWKDLEKGGGFEPDDEAKDGTDGEVKDGEGGDGDEANGNDKEKEEKSKEGKLRVRMATFRRLIEGVFPFGEKVRLGSFVLGFFALPLRSPFYGAYRRTELTR
jgi:hypothetical protein